MNDFLLIHNTIIAKRPLDGAVQLTDQWYISTKNETYGDFGNTGKRYLVFGDLIASKELLFETQDNDIPKLKGNFQVVVIANENIWVYNSIFSLLPIYITSDNKLIGSSYERVEQCAGCSLHIDKKFILENLLFNYGFFNRTKYEEITLLPSNSFITLQDGHLRVKKHFDVIDFFKKPQKTKTANQLSDLFIGTVAPYFPKEHFHIAFTSGFDGRTLVSCATHLKKNFSTFSFGRPENDDVAIPKENAKSLGIPYEYFHLGDARYIEGPYAKNANTYTTTGSLGNGFLYAHFPYSAKEISKKSDYLISGVCGSELFRALHTPGAVTSKALTHVFKSSTKTELREKLKNSRTLAVLNKQRFGTALDELIEEVIDYKEGLPQNISLNQRFYIFVFEEIFRKFFGQWVLSQQRYLNVRTPFLDFDFVKALLRSKYAGANNDFFTNNPLKRIKGQYIYANIIKRTNTTIYHQVTGKGYTPRDVRDPLYRLNIILPFVKKRLKRKVHKPYLDNLGIVSGVRENKTVLLSLFHKTHLFNNRELLKRLTELSPFTPEEERDTLLMSLAILYHLQDRTNHTKPKNK